MSQTWEDRPLSKAKMAIKGIEEQLEILKCNVQSVSRNTLI